MILESSKLKTLLRRRPRVEFGGGAFKSERNYADFIIDGKSLSDHCIKAGYDLVSIFTREWAHSQLERSFRRLLLETSADFPNDRRSIMVCGECGDLGCGAVSVLIESSVETVVWRDFGYENDYEQVVHFDKLQALGPFTFALPEYREALRGALKLMETDHEG